MPAPCTRHEAVRRANAGLPPGLRISYRPRRRGGALQPPYRVFAYGIDRGGCASLEAAVFTALRHRADLRLPFPCPQEQPRV